MVASRPTRIRRSETNSRTRSVPRPVSSSGSSGLGSLISSGPPRPLLGFASGNGGARVVPGDHHGGDAWERDTSPTASPTSARSGSAMPTRPASRRSASRSSSNQRRGHQQDYGGPREG